MAVLTNIIWVFFLHAGSVSVVVVRAQLARSPSSAQRHSLLNLAFVLLLPFHPSVLKPYLNLSLGKTQGMCDLDATTSSKISIEVKLLLQLQCLITSVRLTASLSF